jgi:hypothetical protein
MVSALSWVLSSSQTQWWKAHSGQGAGGSSASPVSAALS